MGVSLRRDKARRCHRCRARVPAPVRSLRPHRRVVARHQYMERLRWDCNRYRGCGGRLVCGNPHRTWTQGSIRSVTHAAALASRLRRSKSVRPVRPLSVRSGSVGANGMSTKERISGNNRTGVNGRERSSRIDKLGVTGSSPVPPIRKASLGRYLRTLAAHVAEGPVAVLDDSDPEPTASRRRPSLRPTL